LLSVVIVDVSKYRNYYSVIVLKCLAKSP
jgi:hypothetical protein